MLLAWIFYLPMAIAGVPPTVFVGVGLIDLLYQFWIHTELVGKLGWFDYVFASPSNHRVHHGVNERYLDKNYGGILIVWDRLFGTFEEEVETPVFGVRGRLKHVRSDRSQSLLLCEDGRPLLAGGRLARQDQGLVRAARLGSRRSEARGPEPSFDLKTVRIYDPPAGRAASILVFLALVAMIGATAAFLLAATKPAARQRPRRLSCDRGVALGHGPAARPEHLAPGDALRVCAALTSRRVRARLAGRRNGVEARGDGAADRGVRGA